MRSVAVIARVVDSRRLTGPSLLLDRPGAILDVELAPDERDRAVVAWRSALRTALAALGWDTDDVASRAHAGGLSLAFAAPPDVLYAATEVNEAAWAAACRGLEVEGSGSVPPEVLAALHESIARETKPWFAPLARSARERGVTVLVDDKRVSVGFGRGSRAWPIEETADVMDRIPWDAVADVPTALVTGTNGKTTTIRLLAAIARAAEKTAGTTTTDHVMVGDEVVAEGDYSGPNGARTALRDRRVEIALLEVARGGILRRGLAIPRTRAALVTNVANDHLGEFGVFDLETLADVKLVVAKAVDAEGRVVLNADDPRLLARGERLDARVTWFTLDPRHPVIAARPRPDDHVCLCEEGVLCVYDGAARRAIVPVADVPIAFGGAATHNVANALAAIGVACALGLSDAAIRAGLRAFDGGPRTNPGRANVWRLGGVTAIVDFAHNPHGLTALAALAAGLPAERRALVIGQAGDRDDDAIREFARTAGAMRPDHVFVKELTPYLRGREPGVVPALIEAELRRCGLDASALSRWDSELDAVRAALAWSRAGDLLLLTTHAQRQDVTALLDRLSDSAWTPGAPLPDPIASS